MVIVVLLVVVVVAQDVCSELSESVSKTKAKERKQFDIIKGHV